jgi:Holliday junction resolvasome RuvABC endonuclease subunit
MAIDASSEGSGIAIIETNINKEKILIHKETIKRIKNISEFEHLKNLYLRYIEIIEKYQPDFFITEDIYIGNNGKTVKLLGTIRGIIHSLAFKYNYNLEIIHTLTMKATIKKLFPQYEPEIKNKLITRGKDKGKVKCEKEKDKDLVFRILKEEYHLKDVDNNVTDAIALILTYLVKNNLY